MKISNSNLNDLDAIFSLYKQAANHQRVINAVVIWPEFNTQMVINEIADSRQWKLEIEGKIACVWATTFSDLQIWEEKNKDAAVYIHRIATNPDFRGQNFVAIITNWAIAYAKTNRKDYVRLDTLGNNEKLIAHYKNAGFNFLGMFTLKNTEGLPEHYHHAPACLFEIKLL